MLVAFFESIQKLFLASNQSLSTLDLLHQAYEMLQAKNNILLLHNVSLTMYSHVPFCTILYFLSYNSLQIINVYNRTVFCIYFNY